MAFAQARSVARKPPEFRFLDLPGEVRNLIYDAVYDDHSYSTATKIPSQLTPLSPLIFSLKRSPLWHAHPQIRREILSYYGSRSHLTVNLPNDLVMRWLEQWVRIVGDDFCSQLRSLRIRGRYPGMRVDVTLTLDHGTRNIEIARPPEQTLAAERVHSNLDDLIKTKGITNLSASNILALVICASETARSVESELAVPAALVPTAPAQTQSQPNHSSSDASNSDSLQRSTLRLRRNWNRLAQAISRISKPSLRGSRNDHGPPPADAPVLSEGSQRSQNQSMSSPSRLGIRWLGPKRKLSDGR